MSIIRGENMKDNYSSPAGSGIGIVSLLGLIFIVLKLCHVINWSWWWVTAPFWMPFVVFIVIFAIALMVVAAREKKNE